MKRTITGNHGGTGWWLAQRLTSAVVLVAGLILSFSWWRAAPFDYPTWRAALANDGVRLLVWLLVSSVCLHAWVGLRDVLMDYVKPFAIRLLLNLLILLVLLLIGVWATVILWASHG